MGTLVIYMVSFCCSQYVKIIACTECTFLASSYLSIQTGVKLVSCSYCFHVVFVFGPLFSVLSFLVQNSLWLVEEVLTLLSRFLNVGMEIS